MLLLWVGITISFIIGRDITAQETREFPMIPDSKTTTLKEHGSFDHLKTRDTVRDIVNHPAFKGFGQLILPEDNNAYHDDTLLSNVGSLMPYHSHVDPDIVVGALNHMIDEVKDGKTIFYDFYTEQQKREDQSLSTGAHRVAPELGGQSDDVEGAAWDRHL